MKFIREEDGSFTIEPEAWAKTRPAFKPERTWLSRAQACEEQMRWLAEALETRQIPDRYRMILKVDYDDLKIGAEAYNLWHSRGSAYPKPYRSSQADVDQTKN